MLLLTKIPTPDTILTLFSHRLIRLWRNKSNAIRTSGLSGYPDYIFMKSQIHPQYFTDCVVTCACGNTFVTGSTMKEIRVELCSKCHPFYTGKQKFVDTARRVEKFQEKMAKVSTAAAGRKGKKVKKAAATAKKVAKKAAAKAEK